MAGTLNVQCDEARELPLVIRGSISDNEKRPSDAN